MNTKVLGCISSSEVEHLFCQYLATAFWLKNSRDVYRVTLDELAAEKFDAKLYGNIFPKWQ